MTMPRFWRESGSRYRLLASKCGNCSRIFFPKRSFCPVCHRASIDKMQELTLSGRGVVDSFSIVHQAVPEMEDKVPYVVAIVRLDEGPRVTSQITGVDPTKVEVGMPVAAAFRRLGEESPSGVIYYGFKFVPRSVFPGCPREPAPAPAPPAEAGKPSDAPAAAEKPAGA